MMFRLAASATRSTGVRTFATRRKTKNTLPKEVMDALPFHEDDEEESEKPKSPPDPSEFVRNPVTAAYTVDVQNQQLSTLDSAALSPNGTVVHGRYGEIPQASAIPLEYLALLRPAAEGAAALRVLLKSAKAPHGTLLVFGASQPNGMSISQLASSAGHAVVAVVDSAHSGNRDFMESLTGMIREPGTALPQEFALSKKNFAELVRGISSGDEGIPKADPAVFLEDFKQNLMDYAVAYPDTRPAAVSEEHMEFNYMEKDREYWQQNMEAYLSQFPQGSPPMDAAKLDAFFSTEQYQAFHEMFLKQTSGIISGDDTPFSPPHIVQSMCQSPVTLDHKTYPGAGPFVPYSFSVLQQTFPEGTDVKPGGPVIGAAIAVTPMLRKVTEVVNKEKSIRAKAEALQFLTSTERACFLSAASVAAQARAAGAPVVVMGGSLPDLETAEVTDADVQEALAAMDIDEEGNSRLNYFCQVYRAGDFPFYGDYAVHRATETLPGPRNIIVKN
jgi:hypothetical protein